VDSNLSENENDYENRLSEIFDIRALPEKIRENSPVISFLWKAEDIPDEKWPVEYVSGNVSLLGYTAEDFTSGHFDYADIVHPDDLRRVQDALTQCCKKGIDFFDHEYRIILRSGDVRWVDERTYILRDKAGNVTHYQGTIFDITEQKKHIMSLEESLRKKKLLEEIINRSPVMAFLWRAEEFWPAEYATENVAKLGYSAEDFMHGRIVYSDLIYPDDYAMVKETLAKKCEEGSDYYTQDYRLLTTDKEILWVRENTFIYRDKHGNATYFQGIIQDITEQKENEIALKRSLEKQAELLERKQALETIINNSPVIAFLWKADPESEEELWPVEFVSDNISKFGYSVDDFLSGAILYGEIIHPDDLRYVQIELSEVTREGGKDFVTEYRIRTKSAEERWVKEQTFIKRNEDLVVTHYMGVIEDITDQKENKIP
jgi:PAS domain S-box-containing protein